MYYFLIGFMGVGKSTIGRYVSKKLNIPVFEMDEEIEKQEGKSVSEIFETQGEKYFRERETDLLRNLWETKDDIIVSCGGGVATFENNVEIMKSKGKIVYLEGSYESLVNRLKNSKNRPLIKGSNLRKIIMELLEKRENLYIKSADYIINTDNKSLKQCGNKLCQLIDGKNINL